MSEVKVGPKSKAILIQVAFKAAIDVLTARGADQLTVENISAGTDAYFNLLMNKFEQFDAGDDPARGGGGGGGGYRGGGGGGGNNTPPKVRNEEKSIIALDYYGNGQLVQFYDNRPFKADGRYSPRAADFQSVNKFDIGDGKGEQKQSLWLKFPDGEDNVEVQEMVRKAVGGGTASAPDTAPF